MSEPSRARTILTVATIAGTAAALIYLLRRAGKESTVAAAEVAEPDLATAVAESVASVQVPAASAPPLKPKEVSAEDAKRAEEVKRLKDRGNKRYSGKQFDLAIADYSKAIEVADPTDPETAKIYGNRAQCYATLEKHVEAEADCDTALGLDPRYVKVLVRRAAAREKQGKREAAIIDYTGALLLSDMQQESATHGVDRLVKQVAKDKTEAHLKIPMRCLPSGSFIATFVDSFRKHRELIRAKRPSVAELTASLGAADGGAPRAVLLVQRALAHMHARAYEEAMSDWAAAVALVSPLGDIGESTAAPPTAAQRESTLKEWAASKDPPPALAVAMLGMFLHLRGNYDDAMACYDYSLELNPKATEVRIQRARLSPSLPSSLMRS